MKLPAFVWNQIKKKESTERVFFRREAIALTLTNRCNFRCQHCFRSFSEPRDLPLAIAKKVLEQSRKYQIKHIALTGGEPFLYPDLEQLIGFIEENGHTFSLVSNGLIFPERLPLLLAHRRRLVHVSFSLDSAQEGRNDALRHPGAYRRLMEDFALCRRHRLPFKIIAVLNAENKDEVFDIALLAKKKGAQTLMFSTVMSLPGTHGHELALSQEQRRELIAVINKVARITRLPVTICAALIASLNVNLCLALSGSEIAIDIDGNMVQCCDLANFGDERVHRRAIITSLADKSFDEGLKELNSAICRRANERIDDYQRAADTAALDFNSCFYCLHKLSGGTKS